MIQPPWLDWAIEIQAITQSALAYCKNPYDIEHYERLRDISAEMLSFQTDLPFEKIKDLFCNEYGYQTPKIEARSAIIEDGKILMVRENDGKWSLPGGWCDVNLSVAQNAVKECREEAGLEVAVEKVVGLLDYSKRNDPRHVYSITKVFLLCRRLSGEFKPNIETTESAFFGQDELPELSIYKNTAGQIAMCFAAAEDENWKTVVD